MSAVEMHSKLSVRSIELDDAREYREDQGEEPGVQQRAGYAASIGPMRHKGRLSKFCSTWTTTVPDAVGITGIKYIVSSNYHALRRLVWILALIGGVGAATFQIVDRSIFYSSNPQSVDVEVTYNEQPTFPAVTICNFNSHRNVEGQIASHPFGQLLEFYNDFGTDFLSLNFSAFESQLSGANTTALYLEYAHHMNADGGMFIQGSWDTVNQLSAENFTRVITDYGVCYTFNSGHNGEEILMQGAPGRTHGLRVVMNVQQDLYYYSTRLHFSSGFLVSVHDQNDVPAVNTRALGVADATEVRIGIRAKKTTILPPPDGNCGFRKLKYFTNYTLQKCHQDCLISVQLDVCGCVEPYLTVSSNLRVCDPIEVFSCIPYASAQFIVTISQCDCPVPCTQITYTTKLSSTSFPATFYSQRPNELYTSLGLDPASNGSVIKGLVVIQVFFEDFRVETFNQQVDYSFFAFLCDIGGALGLWLGGSILTILEILDHLTYATCGPTSSSKPIYGNGRRATESTPPNGTKRRTNSHSETTETHKIGDFKDISTNI